MAEVVRRSPGDDKNAFVSKCLYLMSLIKEDKGTRWAEFRGLMQSDKSAYVINKPDSHYFSGLAVPVTVALFEYHDVPVGLFVSTEDSLIMLAPNEFEEGVFRRIMFLRACD